MAKFTTPKLTSVQVQYITALLRHHNMDYTVINNQIQVEGDNTIRYIKDVLADDEDEQ